MSTNDPTQRFSDRVDDYVRFRPDYPPALLAWLHAQTKLAPTSHVADIGAGTGISSKSFLDAGYEVIAIEPNDAMRTAAQHWLGAYPRFRAIAGRAETTTLANASVDLVVCAQAFHWFDPGATRVEWKRILRPGGFALIVWNTRRLSGTPFLEGYEKLLHEFGLDYRAVAERHPDDDAMRHWFGAGLVATARLDHQQTLDFEGLRGRLLSSSYAPRAGHPRHAPMMAALRKLFDATSEHGRIRFDYDTRAFLGRLV